LFKKGKINNFFNRTFKLAARFKGRKLNIQNLGTKIRISYYYKPFPIQFFCQQDTPQLLFVLGGKELGRLLVITDLKEKNIEKQKEYNLRYLLAKVRTTLGKASDRLP
jgi:hypothetical protein